MKYLQIIDPDYITSINNLYDLGVFKFNTLEKAYVGDFIRSFNPTIRFDLKKWLISPNGKILAAFVSEKTIDTRFRSDGQKIIVSFDTDAINVYSLEKRENIMSFIPSNRSTIEFLFSYDSHFLAIVANAVSINLCNLKLMKIYSVDKHSHKCDELRDIAFSPDNTLFVYYKGYQSLIDDICHGRYSRRVIDTATFTEIKTDDDKKFTDPAISLWHKEAQEKAENALTHAVSLDVMDLLVKIQDRHINQKLPYEYFGRDIDTVPLYLRQLLTLKQLALE